MPLYEYQCTKCRHRFEKIQSFSDPEVRKCPACGGKVEKLLSAPSVQFKGSGWYATDYANKGKSGSEGKADSSEDKSAASPAANEGAGTAKPKEDKKPHAKKKD